MGRQKYLSHVVLVLILTTLLSGCLQEESPSQNQSPRTATKTPTTFFTPPSETKVSKDPVIQDAELYLNQIVLEDVNLRTWAASVVRECPSGDKDCQINKLYRYVVENYDYYSDPRRSGEFIQSPAETMRVKGGDCEDLTILLVSLLENLGIKTYLVLTESHAYCLACGVDSENLWHYIEETIKMQAAKDLGQEGQKVVIEDGRLFVVKEEERSFVLKAGQTFYYGGDGSTFTPPKYLNLKYGLSSSQPLTIYVVPSRADFELASKGRGFKSYPSCKKQNILRIRDSCEGLRTHGGLVLKNPNRQDARVSLNMKFYFYYPAYKILAGQKMQRYSMNDEICVVLEATAGKYGYPGSGGRLEGKKTVIDPMTREFFYLK